MRRITWLRVALLSSALALPALAGCTEKLPRAEDSDKGPGAGSPGGVSQGGNDSPRHGSAATSPERTGPN